ncbi:hypothetical protein CcaverHIS002_0600280 [Cutaneotrichosporon cavernicola]|uniref:Methyltransferase type 11 domain-containing protein n=1 Tax=Cutaneotrichosporon cavernicola TaxID=279322 RepID=A0AA48L5K8_9TREE|nr:uncharacterized protein CcaverHIS019_0500370 [Cutaneotrichosporon cavernicola]BEI85741.1 hypothetical protein CcaverHIS002_0600280 [Cutaneotrichosporon cavernicola]BEI92409.1 hypothetical protein CcaverHIS019_0500370 [Cutaneotrichosporon cavernicola]BEJ00182.1 hypothetical protein CcaverHIS631_0500390 [Cutaneotrichosporon cavernicola]BEJ07953.1 hypothetical protein CcaverHIS641_0500380 [Cutaneotrichosporon cavernicola]
MAPVAASRKPATTNTSGHPALTALYQLGGEGDPKIVEGIYDQWASSYDSDILGDDHGYVGPQTAVRALVRAGVTPLSHILDAGCGTGLVGVYLAQAGYVEVDGIDLSPAMLKQAEKTNSYKALKTVDLTRNIPVPDAVYDGLTCVGTLTHGHVGPRVLNEFVRVVKPNGVIVATVLEDIWDDGFEAETQQLAKDKKVDILGMDIEPYRAGAGVCARTLVMRRR